MDPGLRRDDKEEWVSNNRFSGMFHWIKSFSQAANLLSIFWHLEAMRTISSVRAKSLPPKLCADRHRFRSQADVQDRRNR
jgi:hypothetical protein